jgi:tetratricopeptide (TPR) repeat protein
MKRIPKVVLESTASCPPDQAAPVRAGGPSGPGWWRRVLGSIVWGVVLVGLIALTVWHGLRSQALAEARAAFEGRPATIDLRSTPTTWWQALQAGLGMPAGSRRRRAAEVRTPQPDYLRALQRALDHLDQHPGDREAARLAALCLSHLDFAPGAEPYYQIARGQGGLTREDLHVRALGLTRGNLREQAIAAYQEILQRWPDDPLALQRLAALYYSRAQYRETLKVANRLAQSSDPKWAVAGYSLIATVHHEELRPELAVPADEEVLRLDPELKLLTVPAELFFADFAEDLINTGRAADARRYLHRALQAGDDPALVNLLGAAYFVEGDEADAEHCWKHATALDPKFDRPWIHLGRLAMRRGNWAEAAGYLETAHAIDLQAFEPLYQLSLVYRRLGRTEEAERFRKQAAEVQRRRLANAASPRVGMGVIPDEMP